jgi:hypothetical protein
MRSAEKLDWKELSLQSNMCKYSKHSLNNRENIQEYHDRLARSYFFF